MANFFRHLVLFFLLLLTLSIADYFYLGRPPIGIDDADIFLNYAQHLAKGDGFVFNTGGERVEGFTSMLWVLICSFFYHLSSRPQLLIAFCTLAITSVTVTLVYSEVRKDMVRAAPPLVTRYFLWIFCGYLLCIGPSFVAWSVLSLMENTLWNFLFTAIVVLLLRAMSHEAHAKPDKLLLLLLGPLLILCRPEAMAWILFFSAALAWIYHKKGQNLLFPLLFFAAAMATTGAVVLFRLHYFGYPLPNTYYAKVSPDRLYNIINGLRYAQNFLLGYNPFVSILIIAVLPMLFFSHKREIPARIVFLSFITWMGIMLPCATGGDHFGGFRFYQYLLLPAIWGLPAVFLMYNKLRSTQAVEKRDAVIYMGIGLLSFCYFFTVGSLFGLKSGPHNQLDLEFNVASTGINTAEALNHYWATGNKPTAAVIMAGGFALHYKGETMDLMGLNDVRMGHSQGNRKGIRDHAAFNRDVFYTESPDIVLPQLVADKKEATYLYMNFMNPAGFENRAMRGIFQEARFQNEYAGTFVSDKRNKINVFFFSKKGFLPSLQKDSSLLVSSINF